MVAGVLTGNIIGFARVARHCVLLGTHSHADALAVAMGPIDTLNSVLINSLVFAFVPMLTAREGADRAALFHQLTRCFLRRLGRDLAGRDLAAPLADARARPRLDPQYFATAVTTLRILALSTVAAGGARSTSRCSTPRAGSPPRRFIRPR